MLTKKRPLKMWAGIFSNQIFASRAIKVHTVLDDGTATFSCTGEKEDVTDTAFEAVCMHISGCEESGCKYCDLVRKALA